ncbi:MAG: HD domain-containing protein [Magnetococcales bacterium]|nr:HD domain-containing protein [Magnetococcales bacterium]
MPSNQNGSRILRGQQGNKVHIKVIGVFDHELATPFREAISGRSGDFSYTVDLSQAREMRGSAIGLLMALREYCQGDASRISILSGSPDIDRILQRSHLGKLFKVILSYQNLPGVGHAGAGEIPESAWEEMGATQARSSVHLMSGGGTDLEQQLEAQLLDLDDDEMDEGDDTESSHPPEPEPFQEPRVDFHLEMPIATEVSEAAKGIMAEALRNIANGRPVEYQQIKDCAHQIFDCFQRNPNTILALSLIKDKDNLTFMHSVNVATYLMAACTTMNMDEEATVKIGMGGMLHDVGKAMIPSRILNKKGQLNAQERRMMEQHVELGVNLLGNTPGGLSPEVMMIAGRHHERIDGSGYPSRLTREEIPDICQMAAIADVFDAVTSQRPYHDPLPSHVALKKMMAWCNNQYSPSLVQNFVRAIGIFPVGTTVQLVNGQVGVVAENNPTDLLHPTVHLVYDGRQKRPISAKRVNLAEKREVASLRIKRPLKAPPRAFDPMKALAAWGGA